MTAGMMLQVTHLNGSRQVAQSGVNDADESVVADQFLPQYRVHRLCVHDWILEYHLHTDTPPVTGVLTWW